MFSFKRNERDLAHHARKFGKCAATFLGAAVLMGCVSAQADLPAARWDETPQAQDWTKASLSMLEEDAAVLVETTPADIEAWCPAYDEANPEQRAAFWNGLLSSLAYRESTFRQDAISSNGKWHGLLQISPATARGYGCAAGTSEALREGEANLRCALRIWSSTVVRDGVIAADQGGVAADWGPLQREALRNDIRGWVSEQDYCQS
jgi:hypothetical protein